MILTDKLVIKGRLINRCPVCRKPSRDVLHCYKELKRIRKEMKRIIEVHDRHWKSGVWGPDYTPPPRGTRAFAKEQRKNTKRLIKQLEALK